MMKKKQAVAFRLIVMGIYLLLLPAFIQAAPVIEWQRVVAESPWGVRAMPRGGLLDGYFYVIGGRAGAFTIYGDTWHLH